MVEQTWQLPESSDFIVRDSPDAGRGIFAHRSIPAGTLVLETSPPLSPTAYVILRPYRREVCAWCFAYDRGREWKIRPAKAGLAFCAEQCREEWLNTYGQDGLDTCVLAEACIQQQLKQAGDAEMQECFYTAEEAAQKWVDAAAVGKQLMDARAQPRASKEAKRLLRQHTTAKVDPDALTYLCSTTLVPNQATATSALLALVDNPRVYESASLDPYITAYHHLVTQLPPTLLSSLSAENCDVYISRASQNAFSIRPTADGEHSGEFLGWGIWPEASFFNHSCAPNMRKARDGRVWRFWTSRDVQEGEELCITYLGGEEAELGFGQRQERLANEWRFVCQCKKCVGEDGLDRQALEQEQKMMANGR
jgi:hypothetical protein